MATSKIRILGLLNIAAVMGSLLGIVRAKYASVALGVSAVGALGQIIAIYNLQTQMAGFGIFSLLINQGGKLDREKDKILYAELFGYSFTVLLLTNSVVLLIQLCFSEQLAIWVFGSDRYENLVILLAFIGPLYSLALFWENLIRAEKRFQTGAIGQICAFGLSLLAIFPLLHWFGIAGVILDLYLLWMFSLAYYWYAGRSWSKMIDLTFLFRVPRQLAFYLKFCGGETARKVLVFFSILLFRALIVNQIGMEENGLFQSIWSIGNLLTMLCGTYMLYLYPTLSWIRDRDEFRDGLNVGLKEIMYVLFPVATFVLIFPGETLFLLFSTDFMIMSRELVAIVVFKVIGAFTHVYAIVFLARSRVKEFVLIEGTRSISLVLSALLLIKFYSLSGAVLSVCIAELITLVVAIVVSAKSEDFTISPKNLRVVFGFFIISFLLIIPESNDVLIRVVCTSVFAGLSFVVVDFREYTRILGRILSKKS